MNDLTEVNTKYDAIVVGSGAGGGVAAGILSEAGKKVLLIERGQKLSFKEVGRDHLRNQRLSQYGHNAGPDIDGNPRTGEDGRIIRPHEGGYQNNAATLGSGTRVYAGQAWRFMPQDFQMASIYGVPEGSSLADWPIRYEDLMPYYEKAEWNIGVCGDHQFMTHLPAYNKPYPMPPLELSRKSTIFREGLKRLGWQDLPLPRLINSVPYNGRPACVHCQHCVGFACPVDAKNGTQNTMIERALTSGNCTLVTGVIVSELTVNSAGQVTGVRTIDDAGHTQDFQASVVVLSGGAVETARLLLNSTTQQEANGIGNNSDQVGRHLQGHYYPGGLGLFEQDIYDGFGPGAAIATCQFNHGNDGIVGGGMLADDDILLPIIFWKRSLPPDIPKWGKANKQFMRDNYRRVSDLRGPVQEIPSPDGRVTIDRQVRDRYGIPVIHLSGTTHPETLRTARFMRERAKEWLQASGAIKIWSAEPELYLSGGQHQAGTCRMGDDPQSSVVDRWCKVHGHDNLFIADGSVHVTNGGFNPVLTIMALAWRTAENIAKNW
ncbi:MAG: glucose-methanol-choline oxidoreductase [Anaerolineaceae bacterium]|nr:glucose-methanol-choline oxidoreductase [Anaerolineaceae bacterium]